MDAHRPGHSGETAGPILVTGAAGKTGRAVLRRLSTGGARLRAFVRDPSPEGIVRERGAGEVVSGDLRDPEAVRRAARGVRAIYHICPNMSRDEETIGRSVIAAARESSARLVYHSVLLPRVEEMPHHWRKAQVEDALRTSGLDFSILRPAAYMQNLLQHRASIVERGSFEVPYAASATVAMVDLEDVALAAARVLTEEGHEGAAYDLCSADLLDLRQIARVLSRALGREVEPEVVAAAGWAARARRTGLGEGQIEDLLRMFEYYERQGMRGEPDDLASLLGRPPTSFEGFVRREFAAPGRH